jgi:DNA-binding transcriptional regulator YiaG
MEKRYKSELLGAIHEGAMANFAVGAISEEKMREWDNRCLVQEPQPAPKAARVKRVAAMAD